MGLVAHGRRKPAEGAGTCRALRLGSTGSRVRSATWDGVAQSSQRSTENPGMETKSSSRRPHAVAGRARRNRGMMSHPRSYRQLMDVLIGDIAAGKYQVGELLPGEVELVGL